MVFGNVMWKLGKRTSDNQPGHRPFKLFVLLFLTNSYFFFSHMTISDVGDGSTVTPPVTPPDQWQEPRSSNELDNMQYSPNAAVNGYGPYSAPVTPELISIPPELSPDKLPVEELRVLLRHQLEFYFSRLALLL